MIMTQIWRHWIACSALHTALSLPFVDKHLQTLDRNAGMGVAGAEQWEKQRLDHSSYTVSGQMQDVNSDGGVLGAGKMSQKTVPLCSSCH